MVMLIKCLHRMPVVAILAIGWIVGVECIKNDVEHQDVVVLVDGVFDDQESTLSQIGRVEGRQSRKFNFFPTERNDNTIQQEYFESDELFPQSKSYDEPSTFKFSNEHRQNGISHDTNRPLYNTGEYAGNGGHSPQADGSVVYGKYYDNYDVIQDNEPPRPPTSYQPRPPYAFNPQYHQESSGSPYRPSSSYAQNYNYINNYNQQLTTPQRYPQTESQVRPPQGRPPPARPPQYHQTNYRPPNPSFPPPSHQQSNYAGNYNNYQTQSQYPSGTLSITDFISNLGQSATDLFTGGRPQPQHPQYASNKQPAPSSSTAANPVGMIATAIEAITRHDDLQCIPKIICQMVGARRNQNSLSPVLGSPVFSSLISAVPSTSAGLVYGRAALLGYTAGESRCEGAYPKCPRNEDNLLYYLNNHRGGFFRFFNGGAAYGDVADANFNQRPHGQQQYQQQYQQQQEQYPQYQQQYQQQQQNYQSHPQQSYQQQQEATSTNLAFLTGLADVINQSGGINLSNLGANAGALGSIASFVGGMTGLGGGGSTSNGAAPGGFNVGDVFSNLLTGFVGNRFSSRRISKRSADSLLTDLDPVVSAEKELTYVKQSSSKKRNLNTEMETVTEIDVKPKESLKNDIVIADILKNIDEKEEIFAEDEEVNENPDESLNKHSVSNSTDPEDVKEEDESIESRIVNNPDELLDLPEGRILNKKRPLYTTNAVHFPSPNAIRNEKNIKFVNVQHLNAAPYDVLLFPTNDLYSKHKPQINQGFSFPSITSGNRGSKRIKFEHKEQQHDDHRFQSYNIPADRIKMVFPDRTGTGNLRFDNKEFDVKPIRFGRILSGIRTQISENYDYNTYNNNNYQVPVSGHRNDYGDSHYPSEENNRYQTDSSYTNSNNNYDTNYNKLYESLYSNPNYHSSSQSSSSTLASNRYQRPSTDPKSDPNNVYVTNSKGVVEYYINAAGTKVYI